MITMNHSMMVVVVVMMMVVVVMMMVSLFCLSDREAAASSCSILNQL